MPHVSNRHSPTHPLGYALFARGPIPALVTQRGGSYRRPKTRTAHAWHPVRGGACTARCTQHSSCKEYVYLNPPAPNHLLQDHNNNTRALTR